MPTIIWREKKNPPKNKTEQYIFQVNEPLGAVNET